MREDLDALMIDRNDHSVRDLPLGEWVNYGQPCRLIGDQYI